MPVHAAACFNATIHTVTPAAHAWASRKKVLLLRRIRQQPGTAFDAKAVKGYSRQKKKRRKEKKRKEKKRKGGKKKWRKRKQRKDKKVLHLKVIVFWQAKTYGQAAHDVHSNSVHLVHESQHSFSAHAMQDYWKLQVLDADYAELMH